VALDVPDLTEPALTLADLDVAPNRPGVLPPGVEWERLDPGSYKLRLPGSIEWVRATTRVEVFDDHPENHAFLAPGGDLFEALAASTTDGAPAGGDARGHCWPVETDPDGRACTMVVLTPVGPAPVHTLVDLLNRLGWLPAPGALDLTATPALRSVRCLI
jgi:hypothetical protein